MSLSKITGDTIEILICFKDWLDVEAKHQDKSRYDIIFNNNDTNTIDNQ